MKKLLSAILSVTVMLAAVGSMNVSAVDNEVSYERKEITAYSLDDRQTPITFHCLMREDLPLVPYVSAGDYLVPLFSDVKSESKGSGVYTFKNGDYTMTVDAEKDTVSFDYYEGFLSAGGESLNNEDTYIIGDLKGVSWDFSKYDIDIVEQNGNVYFPYCTLNDMFAETYCGVLYRNDNFKYVDTYKRYVSRNGIDSFKYDDWRDQPMIDMTYNELCFVVDNFYGHPSSGILAESLKENGLDKTLAEYNNVTATIRELLLSSSMEDYCAGLKLLNHYMADGGHTDLALGLSKPIKDYKLSDTVATAKKTFGDMEQEEVSNIEKIQTDTAKMISTSAALGEKKRSAYKNFELIKEWGAIKLFKTGDTFIFDFNSFTEATVEPFKWSVDYASEHDGKYFIIDLSTNGGGLLDTGAYILSMICGTNAHNQLLAASDNLVHINKNVDKNLDGVCDEKDEQLKYDLHFGIITSYTSYSCASMTPSIAHSHGVALIGESYRGGCCNVTPHFNPDGSIYTISGIQVILDESGKDIDIGATPDVPMPGWQSDYEGFYDIKTIKEGLAKFYGEPIPTGKMGDLDDDGIITSADSLLILRQSVALEKFTPEQIALCDVDGDGDVTSADALEVLRYSVGLSTTANIG